MVLLAAVFAVVVGTVAAHVIHVVVVVPLLDPLLSFPSLSTNPTTFMSIYLSFPFIM